MRKNILSLSIAAMVGGLGLAGGVAAQILPGVPTASQLDLTPEGIGHINIVPYYTAQNANITALSIVNTDETNGKAVKVRFRGASNSDDVFDFTLFLSPGDVWSAKVSQKANGLAALSTEDNSCTIPTNVGTNAAPRDFVTARLNPKADLANETREGYVEILNMADIPYSASTSSVYYATKHVAGVTPLPCALGAAATPPAALRALLTETGINTAISAGYLSSPTTGLFTNWSIIDLADGAAWAGAATAVVATMGTSGVAGAGNIVLHPQDNGAPTNGTSLTADPLLPQGKITIQHFDLPDLSTPYTGSTVTAAQQAAKLTNSLGRTSIKNEYVTDDRIGAQTDWVFSMPTRRYSVALDYSATTAAAAPVFNNSLTNHFTSANVVLTGFNTATAQLCVKGLTRTTYDRSEQYKQNESGGVISPSPVTPDFLLCGETAVISFNAGSATQPSSLGAKVARSDFTLDFQNGWINWKTPAAATNYGLPVLGGAFAKIQNGLAGQGNYGVNWDHRFNQQTGAALP